MEQWFQNTRGLVIIVLAIFTGAVLLAIEPGGGFPSGTSSGSSGDGTTVTTTVTTLPPSATTTTVARPTIQEGTPDTGSTTVLQSRLSQLGYTVTVDGSFGPGTTTAVKEFQTAQKITPADGVVNAATWNALLANPPAAGTATTTTTAP